MKLAYVEIKNFRSIKESTIHFEPPCRVLVGINECGKSNVLKALRLLSSDYRPSRIDDVRERVGTEPPIEAAHVRFAFKLEKVESDTMFSNVSERVLAAEPNPTVATNDGDTFSLKDFCLSRAEGLYVVNLLNEKRSCSYWALPKGYKLIEGWKKPSSACPAEYVVTFQGQTAPLNSFKLVRVADCRDAPKDYLEDATIYDLAQLSGKAVIDIVEEHLPETIFWEYDEKDLLPNSIEIEAFAANPNTHPPLRNMFVLSGIAENQIQSSFQQVRKGSPNQIQNYLDQIADQTTAHFRQVWREYRDISFSLRLNGSTIVPGIKEANTHDFAKRSDGFKRFVTFLLMISVKVKTEQMANTLLLIDEPEISLHPTGARYLRDELIRISKHNYVVYSTHSIFMIDPTEIERHYIVKKKGEVTQLSDAKESNIAEEEVLLNALGYSAFEILREKNLIFEGWKDKHLFEVALENASAPLKKKFAAVGICHAKGASSLKAITPLIELAKRDCLIVSDGDGPAISEQKRYKKDKGYGAWFTYQEIDPSVGAITGEDFVKKDFVTSSVNVAIADSGMPEFSEADLPDDNNKLKTIDQWLRKNGMTGDQAKDTVSKIKEYIFEHIEPKHVEATYTKLLAGINL